MSHDSFKSFSKWESRHRRLWMYFWKEDLELFQWRQLFKGQQLERAKEQQARGLQLSGWTTTPDQTKSYLRKGGRMKSILPSAVFFSADSPSQSWSGKRRKLKFGFFQPSGLKEISITQRAEQKLEEKFENMDRKLLQNVRNYKQQT